MISVSLARLLFPVAAVLVSGSTARSLFDSAAERAARGDLEGALQELQASFEAGFERPAEALSHPALAVLRREPEPRRRLRELLEAHARPWRITLVDPAEPGEPLVVSGTVRDAEGAPVAGALVYVYHKDARGSYGDEGGRNPRIFGHMRTDEQGRYEYRTIRPARYPGTNVDQHVHYRISAAGFESRSHRLGFADDPRWRERETPAWARPVTKGPDGVDRCVLDILLARQRPSERR